MSEMSPDDSDHLHDQAYAAFDAGDLVAASTLFRRLLEGEDWANYHYMLGLVHKYLRDWPTSLRHNLRAIALRDEADQASHWNAAIAATALGDWPEARRQWAACGIDLPAGTGPIDGDFGLVSIRLNPWGEAETLYAVRIDPARARLINLPLPASGYRFGDIVLHDGARTGQREIGGRVYPVFNALERLWTSPFQTYAAFLHCEDKAALAPLLKARDTHGVGQVEDWTDSIVHYCLRCSYGTPHVHAPTPTPAPDRAAWQPERNLGIAAKSRDAAVELLHAWEENGGGRVEALEDCDAPLSSPPPGQVWWRGPDDEDGD